MSAVVQALGDDQHKISPFLVTAEGHFGRNVRFDVEDENDLREKAQTAGLCEEQIGAVVALHQKALPEPDDVWTQLKSLAPSFEIAERAAAVTPIRSCTLTALGQALAHSSLVSAAAFDAPLDIWVN